MLTDDQIEAVPGTDVYDADGAKIGQAGPLYTDDATGSPEWVTVHTGLFGMRLNLMPLSQAEMRDDRLTVPFSSEHVKDAPSVDPDDGRLSPEEEQRLFDHYGHLGPRALRRETGAAADSRRLRKYELTQVRSSLAAGERVKVRAQRRPRPTELSDDHARNGWAPGQRGGMPQDRVDVDGSD